MNQRSALRQQLALWSFVLALWCLLVVAFAGHLVYMNALPWSRALLLSCRDWLPWIILAPAVAWLAFRFPLERGRLPTSVPIHVLACMLTVVLCELLAPVPRPFGGPLQRARLGHLPGRPAQERFPPGPGPRPEGPLPGEPGFRPPAERRPFFANSLARAQFNVPIYWVIVSIVQALTLYRRLQERENKSLELERRLADAKLESLRMQLHPHFLFNTLNAISTLVHKNPDAADEMIANLSELLRTTLDTTDQEIPLSQELAFLDRYFEIQQARFGDRLRIEKQVDTAALSVRVPTLILQPLVENAIRHGIEPQPGPGLVSISARRADDRLQLAVRDNGPGIKTCGASSDGIGLANTRARLAELYGANATLVMTSGPGGGCSLELDIPAKT